MNYSYNDIERPISSMFDDKENPRCWNAYTKIFEALECNEIETILDACRLSMDDLVVITGKPRHELYFFQSTLVLYGFDLGMTIEEVYAQYAEYRQERFLDDLYVARLKQLKAQNAPDAEEIAQKERENNALPIVEDLRQAYIDDIEGFCPREENLRRYYQSLVEKIKREMTFFFELRKAK